ncbi:putative mannan endo-1,4-beta-mannosidase F [Lachnellula hyalina]|uniref:mannan endo-1,4-beta-mannosidase n=1 Tax=Lachnellula hyalina TaxID=1316788 RepID=A0A8H8R5D8_9HELO|nr:putative mannan endo-1,4-beta-mannosidase F [Lachnellula hyalina]TVY27169.1 putative mannan endo-1,4-beta-mannosidase F [Lachnellula hyalina]
MKFSFSLVVGLGASCLSASAIEKRNSSKSWAGSNNYYLHALHPEEQTTYIDALKGFGTKVVRLWVTGGSDGCAKSSSTQSVPVYESTFGDYQTSTLAALDSVLSQLHAAGIKAIISPHDANLLPPAGSSTGYNGIDIYGKTYGSSDSFYSSADAKAKYDARLASILNYKSPAFGKAWKDLSEVIMAFDLQNEPMIASKDKLANNDPDDWLCGRANNMKTILGTSAVKIATGGIGGSEYSGHEYNIIDKALKCSAIDILSLHGYMTQASQWAAYVPKLADQAAAQGKKVMVEEWGVGTGSNYDSVAKQAAVFNNAGVPWLYWMVIPGKSVDQTCNGETCCHQGLSTDQSEAFEVGISSSRADFKTLFGNANAASGYQDWTGFVY